MATTRTSPPLYRRTSPLPSVRMLLDRHPIRQRTVIGGILVAALFAFELFNYGTTEFALTDLLGSTGFAGIRWATILALAFCAMDFAGIARLFTPDRGQADPAETWYLVGAWGLAAIMNAMLTWWAVSLALLGHAGLGNEVIDRETLLNGVPVFVAALVWLIRVLVIGTFTLKGERLFSTAPAAPLKIGRTDREYRRSHARVNSGESKADTAVRPAPKPIPRREPGYQPSPLSARRR